jgi:hypothetical protein
MRILCLALAIMATPREGRSSVLTNYLFFFDSSFSYWPQYSLAVNLGDTLVWVNQQPIDVGSNYVESYGGEWKSPVMNPGDSFAFTFERPGFYAYRTGIPIGAVNAAGTVTVNAWTGAPPAVTINAPVDGAFLGPFQNLVQASVTNPANIALVQYFANSNLIGAATNAPYAVNWGGVMAGSYVLTAEAIDLQGGAAWSQQVHVTVTPPLYLWGTRVLPTGELLFYYNYAPPGGGLRFLASTDGFPATNRAFLGQIRYSGVIVDESVRGANVPARFYGFRFPGGDKR